MSRQQKYNIGEGAKHDYCNGNDYFITITTRRRTTYR